MPDWRSLLAALAADGVAVAPDEPPRPVGGGDTHSAWRVATGSGNVFLKTGPASSSDVFDAEAEGLLELGRARALRVPEVLAVGLSGRDAYLALEWIDFGRRDAGVEGLLGRQLALQHRHLGARFGWHRDNSIGSTPQLNDLDADWTRFYRQRRLLVQLQLADSHGFGGELLAEGARLNKRLDRLFDNYRPEPSLLHGDLWGGNWAAVNGEPVVFDPAVYYGDRESDLAMTRLFGGFGEAFYRAYEETWPLADGHGKRVALYQLYHVLNHLNMFGGSYYEQALALLRQLNACLK